MIRVRGYALGAITPGAPKNLTTTTARVRCDSEPLYGPRDWAAWVLTGDPR